MMGWKCDGGVTWAGRKYDIRFEWCGAATGDESDTRTRGALHRPIRVPFGVGFLVCGCAVGAAPLVLVRRDQCVSHPSASHAGVVVR